MQELPRFFRLASLQRLTLERNEVVGEGTEKLPLKRKLFDEEYLFHFSNVSKGGFFPLFCKHNEELFQKSVGFRSHEFGVIHS